MAGNSKPPRPDGERNWRDHRYLSQDGLGLHVRDYGPHSGRLTPVVCVPGLTRTCRDFGFLAAHLATRPRRPRRVLALDLRGRGGSEYDRDAANYTPQREMLDVLDVMAAAGIERAVMVGTSRGGLIAMAIAAARPGALAGVVLNDIGPRIEAQGLMRIAGQLSRMPTPQNWGDAADLMKSLHQDTFTDLGDDDWETFAREVFRDDGGRPRRDFDSRIIASLHPRDVTEGAIPELWHQFAALACVPVLAVRGANSDLLSARTLEEMAARHPDFASLTLPNRGHAPFLREPEAVKAIDGLLDRVDQRAAPA